MQGYRFYFMDAGGSILGYEEVDCADDDSAVRTAAGLRPASAPEYTVVEVWHGARLVHRGEALTRTSEDKAP